MITRKFSVSAKIDLPDQCVVCGKASENNIIFNQEYIPHLATGLEITFRRKFEIPYCNQHLNSFDKKIKYLSYSQATLFGLGFLLLMLLVLMANQDVSTLLGLNMKLIDQVFLEDTIEHKDGLGILNIEGNESESILFLNNKPITLVFYNCDGTTMRYYAGSEFEKSIIDSNVEYEKVVNKGEVDLKKPLAQQFKIIIQLLSQSTYKLELSSTSTGFQIFNALDKHDKCRFYEDYGGTYCYIQTQAQINNAKVKEYKLAIKKGIRPILVKWCW